MLLLLLQMLLPFAHTIVGIVFAAVVAAVLGFVG